MKAMLEREVKLAPPPNLDLSGLGGERVGSRTFDSIYHDTAARDLLRRGVTLRRRVEGDRAAWQLKLPSGAARFELEFEDGETPPEAAVKLLVGLTRRAALAPVAQLRTRRETIAVERNGTHVADVVLDAVTVLDGGDVVAAFDEVEVELADGGEDDLRRLERSLRAAGATDAAGPSKLARALGAPDGAAPRTADTPATAFAAALREQYERMLARDPGTRTGLDPEDLHQFRVATRRLRAFLRAGSGLVEAEWAKRLRAELGWLGRLLGAVRDRDVLIERFRSDADELDPTDRDALAPLFAALDRQREAARSELNAGLESERYLELLDLLEAEPPGDHGSERTLTSIWRRELRRTKRFVAALGEAPLDGELHATRIRVKRARYAAELARAELGERGEAFVEAAKALQDILGAHQDSVVGEQVLRRLAPELPGAALAMGRLVDREQARRAAARSSWRRAWKRLARRGRKLRA
jgi:CHAD domain-containing protein